MRAVDVLDAIPYLIYVIIIMMVFGSNIGSVLLGICVSSWIGMASLSVPKRCSMDGRAFRTSHQRDD